MIQCARFQAIQYDDGLEYAAAGGMPSVTRIGRVMERGRYYNIKGKKV